MVTEVLGDAVIGPWDHGPLQEISIICVPSLLSSAQKYMPSKLNLESTSKKEISLKLSMLNIAVYTNYKKLLMR